MRYGNFSLVAFVVMETAATASTPAPSSVNAAYATVSAEVALKPGEKIGDLFNLNKTQPYVLQRLSAQAYFFQHQHYSATILVGKKGVLLLDAPEGGGEALLQAVRQITELPVKALLYSHAHADHIADAPRIAEAVKKAGGKLRIIASKATADKLAFLGSGLPKPTETVKWPDGSFRFENLEIRLHGFRRPAHTDDAGGWLIPKEKILHLPDMVNPDQPPFWRFAGSENFAYFEANLREVENLDWTYLNGGHGNVGSHEDIKFYLAFIGDLKAAVAKAIASTPWGAGVDTSLVNAHTAYLPPWIGLVSKKATDEMRPKYGMLYGFESSTPANAEMVASFMTSYR